MSWLRHSWLALAWALAAPISQSAEPTPEATPARLASAPEPAPATQIGGSLERRGNDNLAHIARLFGGLTIVGAIGIGAVVLARSGFFRKMMAKPGSKLHVEETCMLGNRQFLVVVRYGNARRLVGVGPGLINQLCELPGAEEDPQDLVASVPEARAASSFAPFANRAVAPLKNRLESLLQGHSPKTE